MQLKKATSHLPQRQQPKETSTCESQLQIPTDRIWLARFGSDIHPNQIICDWLGELGAGQVQAQLREIENNSQKKKEDYGMGGASIPQIATNSESEMFQNLE